MLGLCLLGAGSASKTVAGAVNGGSRLSLRRGRGLEILFGGCDHSIGTRYEEPLREMMKQGVGDEEEATEGPLFRRLGGFFGQSGPSQPANGQWEVGESQNNAPDA